MGLLLAWRRDLKQIRFRVNSCKEKFNIVVALGLLSGILFSSFHPPSGFIFDAGRKQGVVFQTFLANTIRMTNTLLSAPLLLVYSRTAGYIGEPFPKLLCSSRL